MCAGRECVLKYQKARPMDKVNHKISTTPSNQVTEIKIKLKNQLFLIFATLSYITIPLQTLDKCLFVHLKKFSSDTGLKVYC